MEIPDHAITHCALPNWNGLITHVYLDGNKFSLNEACFYLKGQGFTQEESDNYVRLLCEENTIDLKS